MNSKRSIMQAALALLITTLFTSAAIAQAQSQRAPKYASGQIDLSDPTRVDIALVLAVDDSSSVKSDERLFQREAYAAALSAPRVADMALGGGAGRVAIAYIEWSGTRFQRDLLPMTVMSSRAELMQFAQGILAIEDVSNDPMFVQPTAVGDALIAAEAAMATLPFRARDYIIDISGDGVINDGSGVTAARERLLEMGLTVNGLPIEVTGETPGLRDPSFDHVARFYADCVIGGPGAFHLIARGFGDVRETLIMKLMLEMAQISPVEKRRIARAWNTTNDRPAARIIPAIALQLGPSDPPPTAKVDCGDPRRTTYGNPFNITP